MLIFVLFAFSTSLKTKSKKTETVMGFFNDMFLENSNNGRNINYRRDNATADGNGSGTNGTLSDWLEISSPSLKSWTKYPPIILPDGREVRIKTDNEFFRINDAFDPEKKEDGGAITKRQFWFRLSGTHLYYSDSKTDINVLGAISIDFIEDAFPEENDLRYCFDVKDKEALEWKLCAISQEIRLKWVCAIKKALDLPIPYECSYNTNRVLVNISKTILEERIMQPIILIPIPSKKCNEKWNYNSFGTDWECTCKDGIEQSPIDLPSGDNAIGSPVAPLFEYEEVSARSPISTLDGQTKSEEYIKIKYFANALRIFHPNFGKIVTLDGAVYVAEEIVFHTPSEHTIEGKRYDMEMQVIHYGQTRGDIAKQVVLSFLFQKKSGVYNKFLEDVDFFSLPNPVFKERDITNNLFIPKVLFSSTETNPTTMKPFSFYTYQGSLTFPPCSERTIHYVASSVLPVASSSLELLREALKAPDMTDQKTGDIYVGNEDGENYRETQPINNRPVFFYDHTKYCKPEVTPHIPVKKTGHYEKVPRKAVEYFWVNGEDPSGIPGSYVVTEKEAKGQADD